MIDHVFPRAVQTLHDGDVYEYSKYCSTVHNTDINILYCQSATVLKNCATYTCMRLCRF